MSGRNAEYPKGIMEQIQKLIAPPTYKNDKRKKAPARHKYYKKPGKQHNKNFCHSCGEGGNLLCCDSCPLSFHLLCLNPPMDEDDIPTGDWFCHACTTSKNKSKTKTIEPKVKRRKLNKPELKSNEGSKLSSELQCIKEAWRQLVEIAVNSNPTEYKSDIQYCTIPFYFPGDRKSRPKVKNIKNMRRSKLSGYTTPPSKTCFYCYKSCNQSPLISCDYCPESFHLDCLNPPLTAPPKCYWMCPLHIEPYIEEKLFSDGYTISQRVELWNKLRKPIDQEAVKLEFYRKMNNERLPLPSTLPKGFPIPDYVISSYLCPPNAIPSLKSALKLDGYEKSMEAIKKMNPGSISLVGLKDFNMGAHTSNCDTSSQVIQQGSSASKEEQELWLECFLQMQRDFALNFTKAGLKQTTVNSVDLKWNSFSAVNSSKDECSNGETAGVSGEFSVGKADAKDLSHTRPEEMLTKIILEAISLIPECNDILKILHTLDDNTRNILAFQRIGQLLNFKKIKKSIIVNNYPFPPCDENQFDVNHQPGSGQLKKSDITNKNQPETSDHAESHQIVDDKNSAESIINLERSVLSGMRTECSIKHNTFKEPYLPMTEACLVPLSDSENSMIVGKEVIVESNTLGSSKKCNKAMKPCCSRTEKAKHRFPEKSKHRFSEKSKRVKLANGTYFVEGDNYHLLDENKLNKLISSGELIINSQCEMQAKKKSNKTSNVHKEENNNSNGNKLRPLPYAVLTCITSSGPLIEMKQSSFHIGIGSRVDLDLSKYGHCNFISSSHAIIFRDKHTFLYEVLNYSPHGCVIDNVRLSGKRKKVEVSKECDNFDDCAIHNVKKIIESQSRLHDHEKQLEKERLKKELKPCKCDGVELDKLAQFDGWEGSATIHHGSCLVFGCIRLPNDSGVGTRGYMIAIIVGETLVVVSQRLLVYNSLSDGTPGASPIIIVT